MAEIQTETTLTVQEILDALMQVEDKSLPVFVWSPNHNLYHVSMIDTALDNRVDINITGGPR
jgi:hypothetical protein